MHIVFYGAGGIGGYFGARLLAAGEHVSFVARGRHAQAMRERGLRVKSPLGDAQVAVPSISDDPAALPKADLVVFAVKMPDAESAAARLGPLLKPGTVVLPLQNGVEIVDVLTAALGAAPVALGAAYIPAKIAEPGVIEHAGGFASLRFGALRPEQRPALEAFAAACARAKVQVEIVDDMRRVMWEKFVFLVGMSSLTALTRLPIAVTRSDPELRRLLQQVMDETTALARAEGVALADDFVARQMTVVDGLPAQAKASMANDLDAGRPLELPWLAGAVVRRSERIGLHASANRFIVAALGPYVRGAPAGNAR
ncbi:MAG TPA: 2-dehydropantoate 2-reductase [Burkholderiaceae bacterium]|nr:2-dehydropantoate 2-reductase [Burkholderiaceae bacterium]